MSSSSWPCKIIYSWVCFVSASVHSMATPLGAILSGYLMDYFGRKRALQLAMLPLTAGWLLISIATHPMIIICGRLLCGFAVGSSGAPAQVVISEISEPHLRGILSTLPMVGYALGILIVYTAGSFFDWRTVALLNTILPFVSIALFMILPETPGWLLRHGKLTKATAAMKWFRSNDMQAEKEMKILVSRMYEESNENNNNNGSKIIINNSDPWYKLMARPEAIKPLLIISVFSLLQVFSGAYMIVFYAVDIIDQMNIDIGIDNSTTAVLTGVIRLICIFIAVILIYCIGRRPLAISSALLSGTCALTLGIFIHLRESNPLLTPYDLEICLILLVAFIAGQSIGILPLFGILMGELSPTKLRGIIGGLVLASFNILLFISIKLYPAIKHGIGIPYLLIIFGVVTLTGAGVIYLILPETKKMSLSEIEDYFLENNFLWVKRNKTPVESKGVI